MGLLIKNRGILIRVKTGPIGFDNSEPLNFFVIHQGFVFFQSKNE
jgi:hypothetical protein